MPFDPLSLFSKDDRLFLRIYERYRGLTFYERARRSQGKGMNEFERERYNCRFKTVVAQIERSRYGPIPPCVPTVYRGYWVLRWMETAAVLFPQHTIEVDVADTVLFTDAFSGYCAERSYIHAAVILRLTEFLNITVSWPDTFKGATEIHIRSLASRVM